MNDTLSVPSYDDGAIIDTLRTVGKVVTVRGKLPKSSNPGVLVVTFWTVHGTLPPGPGKPHVMNGITPWGWLTVPESSPFSPQASSEDWTFNPVMTSEAPGGCVVEALKEIAITTRMMMTKTTKTTNLIAVAGEDRSVHPGGSPEGSIESGAGGTTGAAGLVNADPHH